jgi:hypothetical protein
VRLDHLLSKETMKFFDKNFVSLISRSQEIVKSKKWQVFYE